MTTQRRRWRATGDDKRRNRSRILVWLVDSLSTCLTHTHCVPLSIVFCTQMSNAHAHTMASNHLRYDYNLIYSFSLFFPFFVFVVLLSVSVRRWFVRASEDGVCWASVTFRTNYTRICDYVLFRICSLFLCRSVPVVISWTHCSSSQQQRAKVKLRLASTFVCSQFHSLGICILFHPQILNCVNYKP